MRYADRTTNVKGEAVCSGQGKGESTRVRTEEVCAREYRRQAERPRREV